MPIRRWDKSRPPSGPWVLNRDSIQAQNLLVWHPLDDGASAGWRQFDYADSVGSHATSGSGMAGTRDRFGKSAVTTNGSTDYFYADSGKVVFQQTSQWCVSVIGTQKIAFGNWNRDVGPGWEVGEHWTGGKVSMILCDATGSNFYLAEETSSSADGLSHDYFFVHDGSQARTSRFSLYKDGVSASSTYRSFGTADPGTLGDYGMAFGRTRGAFAPNWRVGTISDLRIYTGVAAAARLAQAISDPATRFELWYPLRSRKWISAPSGVVVPYWAFSRNRSGVLGAGRGF